jgi:hypothetical protein
MLYFWCAVLGFGIGLLLGLGLCKLQQIFHKEDLEMRDHRLNYWAERCTEMQEQVDQIQKQHDEGEQWKRNNDDES